MHVLRPGENYAMCRDFLLGNGVLFRIETQLAWINVMPCEFYEAFLGLLL